MQIGGTGYYQPVGIAHIDIRNERIGHNGLACGAFYLKCSVDGNGHHRYLGTAKGIYCRHRLYFLHPGCEENVRLFC